MENNPLLEVLNTPKNRVYDVTDNYLRHVSVEDFKAHILDLLEKQRQKCYDYCRLGEEGVCDEDELKDSILNAKLIETQNKQ